MDLEGFIKHLIKEYPPKCQQGKEEVSFCYEDKKARKCILRVISYYHPDKQPLNDELNMNIAEEITKHLNDLLGKFKKF